MRKGGEQIAGAGALARSLKLCIRQVESEFTRSRLNGRGDSGIVFNVPLRDGITMSKLNTNAP